MIQPDTLLQNRYRIISQISKGGMGTVYLAKDDNLGILVAVKQNIFEQQRLIEAFKREARLLASLRHSALPQIKDHFLVDDVGQFLVMEYIPGDDLEMILEKRRNQIEPIGYPKPFDIEEIIHWTEQLLDALDYLHTRPEPVIHRDIKPQNLKIAERQQIILLDFGLAKGKPVHMTRVTTTGSLYGYTPNYAPIEQIRGVGTDPRSDLYALGATLYHLITGFPPSDAATRADAFLGGEPDPLLPVNQINPQVPKGISDLLMKAMQQHRNNRPASAAEMLKMLRDATHSTVLDWDRLGEAEDQKKQEEQERLAERDRQEAALRKAESDRKQEEETKKLEEVERLRLQQEQERQAQEVAENRKQEQEQSRKAEAERLRAEEDRRAQQEAEQKQQEQERQRKAREEQKGLEGKPSPEEPISPKKKTRIIAAAVVFAIIVLAGIIGLIISKRDTTTFDTLPIEQKPPATLKAGEFMTSGKVHKVSLSDDGRVLVVAGNKSTVHLLQPTGERMLTGKSPEMASVAVSRDGQTVVAGGNDGSISLWRVSDGEVINTLKAHSDYIFSVGFNPDGKSFYSASGDKTVKLLLLSKRPRLRVRTVNTPEKGFLIVAVSPDLKLVGFYHPDRRFKLWATADDSFLRYLEGDVPSVNCGAFSDDSQMLALGSRDGDVQVWRTNDGRMMKSLGKFEFAVASVAFNANGQMLAAGFTNGMIKLWRVGDGNLIKTFEGHTDAVNSLSLSADGRTLASGSDDNTVRVWNVEQ